MKEQIQQPDVGEWLMLYELDASNVSGTPGDMYYFAAGTVSGTYVAYNSQNYSPADVTIEGIQSSGEGEAPRPTLTVANVGTGIGITLAGLIINYDGLVGASVEIKIVRAESLDTGSDPGVDHYSLKYIVNNCNISKDKLTFELKDVSDLAGQYGPGRMMLRDNCQWRYRYWDGSDWDYSNATCPHTDTTYYFTEAGVRTTTASEDKCGKRFSDCKLRFIETTASGTVYIQDTEPGSPTTKDLWLDTANTPNIWYEYDGSDWGTATFQTIPYGGFPLMSKVRV
jgi:lambda family phage minor tail protein L